MSQSAVFDALMRYWYGVPLPPRADGKLRAAVAKKFRIVEDETTMASPMLSPIKVRGKPVTPVYTSSQADHTVIPMSVMVAASRIQLLWKVRRDQRQLSKRRYSQRDPSGEGPPHSAGAML